MEDKKKETGEEGSSVIDEAREQADRLELANKKQEELIIRQEELYAKQVLGGKSSAGSEAVKPKEETPQEYRARIDKEISEGKHGD